MSDKLDIFDVLNNISTKNTQYFSDLTPELQKQYVPFVITRWLSGTTDKRQVYLINEVVNNYTFSLQQHKQLLHYLMTICTSGNQKRYAWNKLPSKATTSKPLTTQVVADYFKYSIKDAKQVLHLLSKEQIIACAEQLGRQNDEITKIKKELK